MSDRVQVVANDEKWRSLLGQFADANHKVLAEYAAAAARRVGATSENVAIIHNEETLGICNVRIKNLPCLPFGIAYINGGPLVLKNGDVTTLSRLSRCLSALHEEYVDKRGHVLRVVGSARAEDSLRQADASFIESGYQRAPAKGHYRTILVDLLRDLSQIRQGLDQKWRNILNKAERQGVSIEPRTDNDAFLIFDRIYRELVARKGFEADLGPDFFAELQGRLGEQDQFVIHLASHEGNVVAGHLGAYHGDTAVYLLGAATEAGLRLNASYLLQWQVIQHAQSRGCIWYDLGGVDPEQNPDVFRFKSRMGGRDVSAPGPYEAGSTARRWIVRHAEAVYRKIKK